MRVTFVGTGNAFASGARNAMAILLRGDEFGVLLDCGPTTLVALKKLGLSPADVDVILLSHHHGDHFGGVPFLALHECYQGPREKPLRVLGPEGTETKVAESVSLFFPGMEASFPLEYRDLAPNERFTLGTLRATPFEVDHYSRSIAFGYRVELSGKTVVFSGDTAWTDELARQSSDADLFVCECSSFDTPIDKHMSHRDLEDHRAAPHRQADAARARRRRCPHSRIRARVRARPRRDGGELVMGTLLLALTLLQTPPANDETVIDIDIKDADVLDVLRLLAEVGGFNLIADPDVSCSFTLKLEAVPWSQVLDIVLHTCRLAEDRIGDNIVRVATFEQLRRESEERRKYEEEKRLAGPLRTTYRKLAYGRARDIAPILEKFLSPRGSVVFDERTNTLIITDVAR